MSDIEPQPDKIGRTLLILMWKHYTVRKRRLFITTTEILSPLVFFALLYLIKGYIAGSHINNITDIQLLTPVHITQLPKPSIILYYPDNDLTKSLMIKVGASLGMERLTNFTDYFAQGYFGSNNYKFVEMVLQYFQIADAIVLFRGMDGSKLPDHLNYTIRIKTDFQTYTYIANPNLMTDPMIIIDYFVFVRLQWAIDSNYLELRTGQPIKQRIFVQGFPYSLLALSSVITSTKIGIIHMALLACLLLTFEFIMARLMEERSSGIQELIQLVGVTRKILGLSHFLNVLPGGVLFALLGALLLTTGTAPLLEYSDCFLIGVFLFLHFISVVAMAFVCSFITNDTDYANSLATLFYFGLMVPSFVIRRNVDPGLFLMPLTGVIPYIPVAWFHNEAHELELRNEGITLKTMWSSHSERSSSMFSVYMCLMIQSLVYFMLAWYLSLVRPHVHGAALPWNFFLQKDYWSTKKLYPSLESDEQVFQGREAKYFEKHPPNNEIGIDIRNVTKVFDSCVALNNFSLPVFKGEITVLLGHNGAGKTTLMSIVTGRIVATSGKVYVNGLDTVLHQTAVRSQLGFCPQHNLFFTELTVLEHVRFFCLVKGSMTWEQSRISSLDLLKKLGLEEKAHSLSSHLSGGMKRRLQLACALAGDANVLVLDEPTAGLDVETRRSLWDLLLSLRVGRTVLLSTHFMEEADALADRIAALHNGRLQCDSSPMQLKKEIDTGYNLSIILKPNATQTSIDEITKIIASVVRHTSPQAVSGIRTLKYKLPNRECDKFPTLFKKLEESKDQMEIESMSMGVTSIEEVFLELCNDTSVVEDEVVATLRDDITQSKITGRKLIKHQFVALFIRQIRFIKSSWISFVFLQLALPILMLFAFIYVARGYDKTSKMDKNPAAAMDLSIYKNKIFKNALSNYEIPVNDTPACCDFTYEHSDNITQTLVDKLLEKHKLDYYKFVIGITLKNTIGVAHFSLSVRHALPVSVNALVNVIASTMPVDDPNVKLQITTINHPIEDPSKLKIKHPKSTTDIYIWTVIITFTIQTTLINVLVLPDNERRSYARRLHLMAGCSPELYWLVTLTFHMIYFVLALVLPTVLFAAILDIDSTICQANFLFPLALLLVGACLSSIAFSFLVSFMLPYKHAATVLVAFYFICSFILPTARATVDMYVDQSGLIKAVAALISAMAYTVPPYTFLEAMKKISEVARINAYCNLNKDLCPELEVAETGFDREKCCVLDQPPRCYFCFDDYSPLPLIIILYIQFFLLMVLVMMIERRIFNRLNDFVLNRTYQIQKHGQRDEVLENEQLYVEQSLKNPCGDAMICSSVHKCYPKIFHRTSTVAVRGISFAVREGECFGLVGVNGAGKSTTFNMMTCATFPTRGIIVANGHHQHIFDNSKYLSELGYCPQFFGMDGFLTGRQNLELLLALQGLDKEDAAREAARWLALIDLMKYADRKVNVYSGGCSRRLSSVAALARRATLSLLDEPTAGVDVAARRQLWRAVRAARAQTSQAGKKRAVLITSHSMDEMEALCSRVAIMRAGQLVALGSPAALRAAHNAGLSLFIKIKDTGVREHQEKGTSTSTVTSPDLQELKQACSDNQWTLKYEHRTILNYHVDKAVKIEYSELFTKLEELRTTFLDLIEDYSVTATTLEEVFLSYA